jgi:hypothetical protein
LSAGDTVLSGDLQFDLSTLALGGTGSLSFKNTDNAEADGAANLRYSIGGTYDAPSAQFDRQPLVQFLTQRALEREQERVEAMQASIVEKQQLRRQLDLLTSDEQERERVKQEEEARKKAEADARAEAQRRAEQMQNDGATIPVPSGGGAPLNGQNGQSLNDFLKSLEPSPDTQPSPQTQP